MIQLRNLIAVLGLAASGCVAAPDESSTDTDLTAASQYHSDSVSTSGNLTTFTGPYLTGTNGYKYRIYQKAPYTLSASKFCVGQGLTLSSYTAAPAATTRVAWATSLAADWTFYGTYTNPTIATAVICVVPPPPPPPPPPGPAPTVTLSANPTINLPAFGVSTLTWSSTNATSCTASGIDYFGDPTWTGSRATSGTESSIPITVPSATYTLTCKGTGGSAAASVTISMDPNDPCDGCWDY